MSLLEDLFVGDVRQGGILPRLRALEAEVALQGQAAAEAQGVKPRMEALEGLLRDQGRLPCEGQQAREATALDAGRAAAAALEVPRLAVAVPHALELAPDREADEGSGAAEPEVPKPEPVAAERSGGCPQGELDDLQGEVTLRAELQTEWVARSQETHEAEEKRQRLERAAQSATEAGVPSPAASLPKLSCLQDPPPPRQC